MTGYGDPFADDQALDLNDMPLCPVCPAGQPYNVESRGQLGLECLNCRTIFAGTPGEMTHPRNRKRARIVAEYAKHEAATAARRDA